jgi:hypothetical protein
VRDLEVGDAEVMTTYCSDGQKAATGGPFSEHGRPPAIGVRRPAIGMSSWRR